mmetsp:Transcript_3962/g.8749  ORF Transcript_3962/g.8749 Transcript_3962/m.8749 type:complete len:839 (+) Transcript_3962:130-2646(+)|eukprot:CAMPEP_0183742220 /NCGR_PEP_ID=MMETSP0737-20130205/64211_1 /TAXON_ID=385413 /ORGANISM="Thalassiosira miniscula, Strain CCMP1093" /LENGTH=838 /DNA_ID=CAMNT_0025977771 /DNA_START=23 /DNA_END=2539 /DNA_ORIENTATION=-
MTHRQFIVSAFLPALLMVVPLNTHAGTINICGGSYQDAVDNCGLNPSCAGLQCPNQSSEERGLLMSCFAIPEEKCNFGPPADIADPNMPLELDPTNTNYCGPIDGGWQLAVDYCSPLTACKSGLPDECGNGWTCYGGIVCEPSSKSNEHIAHSDANNGAIEPPFNVIQSGTTTTLIEEMEGTIYAADEVSSTSAYSTVASNPNGSGFAITATASKLPEMENSESTPLTMESSATQIENTQVVSPVLSVVENKSYCGPVGAQGWERAANMCSRSTMCDASGACPDGLVCYGGISCNGINEALNPSTSTSTTSTTYTSTATTTSSSTQTSTSTIESLSSTQFYCGPDPSKDHSAWATALEKCSPETSCVDGICPDGQICYGGINCLAKPMATSTSDTGSTYASIVSSTASTVVNHVTSDATEASTTQSAAEASTTVSTSENLSNTRSTGIIIMSDNAKSPENDEQTPPIQKNMYCGPDPRHNGDAWMTALANCSPQTACGTGRPCGEGQFCYGEIDCSTKNSFVGNQAVIDGTVAVDDAKASTTTTSTTAATSTPKTITTTTAAATSTTTTTTNQEVVNTFFCGPNEEGGWTKAGELCIPCHNGDPSKCGVGLTCYAQVTSCAEKKPELSSAANEMLLEVEEGRGHIGYCGVDFSEAQRSCSVNQKCINDYDCDDLHPTCFAVRCEDKEEEESSLVAVDTVSDGNPSQAEKNDVKTVVVASFCGSWYEETTTECTSRRPCKISNDCDTRMHEGCFSDITCVFDEQSSTEYQIYLANVEALEKKYSSNNSTKSSNNANDGSMHSNLRIQPDPMVFDARSSAMGSSLHVFAIFISTFVSLFL